MRDSDGNYLVSIHAPRTGRDQTETRTCIRVSSFNPRAPHGARLPTPYQRPARAVFQSTRPARGATSHHTPSCEDLYEFQSTRPARGATGRRIHHATRLAVSIHAPRTGRDDMIMAADVFTKAFQSTRPARGATMHPWWRDVSESGFNPRAPHGARQSIHTYQ